MKLKNSRNLDARQSLLLESAFYSARPPERTAARRKQRPPLHEYMRHLVHERLTHAELKQARLMTKKRAVLAANDPDAVQHSSKCRAGTRLRLLYALPPHVGASCTELSQKRSHAWQHALHKRRTLHVLGNLSMCPCVLWQVVRKLRRLPWAASEAHPGSRFLRDNDRVRWQVARKLRRLAWAASEAHPGSRFFRGIDRVLCRWHTRCGAYRGRLARRTWKKSLRVRGVASCGRWSASCGVCRGRPTRRTWCAA